MLQDLKNSFSLKFFSFLFIVLTVWWITIYFRGLTESSENNAYTLIYPFLALAGGVIGIRSASGWGGFKSQFGTAVSLLSYGLLMQFLGQAMYAYYIYIDKVEVPYPSLGDIGYFGSVILYIVALFYISKIVAVRITFASLRGKFVALVLPLLFLGGSYFFFLREYEFDWSSPIKIFLDFGYPFGQAIYVSLALLIILLSRTTLGGLMRRPLMYLLFALIIQYFSDFMFLYQANNGTWYVAGPNDFLYSLSYFAMTVSLISIGTKLKELNA